MSPGDPVQSLLDSLFYLRTPTGFVEMPYETIKRMYASTQGPTLEPVFDKRIVKPTDDAWEIPILLDNGSSAVATDTTVLVEFLNADACANIVPTRFRDVSAMNPGTKTYAVEISERIYRGLRQDVGRFRVTMKKGARAKRILRLQIYLLQPHARDALDNDRAVGKAAWLLGEEFCARGHLLRPAPAPLSRANDRH